MSTSIEMTAVRVGNTKWMVAMPFDKFVGHLGQQSQYDFMVLPLYRGEEMPEGRVLIPVANISYATPYVKVAA